jgi:glutamine synthetase
LPDSLSEALAALRENGCFRAGFGDGFVDYYAHIKEAEIARCRKEAVDGAEQCDVTAWEHREYFDLF